VVTRPPPAVVQPAASTPEATKAINRYLNWSPRQQVALGERYQSESHRLAAITALHLGDRDRVVLNHELARSAPSGPRVSSRG